MIIPNQQRNANEFIPGTWTDIHPTHRRTPAILRDALDDQALAWAKVRRAENNGASQREIDNLITLALSEDDHVLDIRRIVNLSRGECTCANPDQHCAVCNAAAAVTYYEECGL